MKNIESEVYYCLYEESKGMQLLWINYMNIVYDEQDDENTKNRDDDSNKNISQKN